MMLAALIVSVVLNVILGLLVWAMMGMVWSAGEAKRNSLPLQPPPTARPGPYRP